MVARTNRYFAVKREVRLVAVGIETEAGLETLHSLGVAYGQAVAFATVGLRLAAEATR